MSTPKPAARVPSDGKARRRREVVEARLDAALAERQDVEARLADPTLYESANDEAQALSLRLADLAGEIETLELEWLDLSARLD